jgi:hypothetical protein
MVLLVLHLQIVSLSSHRHVIPVSRHRHRSSPWVDAAMAADLGLFVLDVLGRSFCGSGSLENQCQQLCSHVVTLMVTTHLVFEHEDVVVLHEISVDIFQSPASSFWVEQVDERYESTVEYCPDDVELPVERVDADWGDFDNDEVAL